MSVLDSHTKRVAAWEPVFPGHAELLATLEIALQELREKRWPLTVAERLPVLNGVSRLMNALGNLEPPEDVLPGQLDLEGREHE